MTTSPRPTAGTPPSPAATATRHGAPGPRVDAGMSPTALPSARAPAPRDASAILATASGTPAAPASVVTSASAARLVSRLKMRHLSLLVRMAQGESLTRVAEALGISQPAATKALGEIEDVFNAPLFARTARGLRPTALGELAIVRARHMLQDIDHWALEMDAARAGHSARLNVGAIPFITARLLVPTIARLHERHRITVTLHRATTDLLLESLRGHVLDCVIGRASVVSGMEELRQEVLYPQRPALIAHPEWAQRMARKPPVWHELATMNWILPTRATPIGHMVSELFTRAGEQPPVAIAETYSMDIIAGMMAADPSLISIVPEEIAADLARTGTVAVVPWAFDWVLPPISLIRRRRAAPLRAEDLFVQTLREVCKEMAVA